MFDESEALGDQDSKLSCCPVTEEQKNNRPYRSKEYFMYLIHTKLAKNKTKRWQE